MLSYALCLQGHNVRKPIDKKLNIIINKKFIDGLRHSNTTDNLRRKKKSNITLRLITDLSS